MEYQNNHETIITKLTIKEKPAYLKVLWENNENIVFSIEIFYEDSTWMGSFTCDAANKYKGKLKETAVYLEEVKDCLCKENPMYKYDFIFPRLPNIENLAKFSWKKLFEGSSAVIVHGELEVQRHTTTKDTLIDSLLQENQRLKVNLENCINDNKKANCELENYQDKLEKLNNMMSSLEDTLYSKFVQVLNSKKRRIQVLTDALNDIETNEI